MNMFTGDLYSMYVVLKGIWCRSYIRVYMIYVIPFGELQVWISEVPKLERFNKKTGPPEMINFFLYCIKENIFSSSPKGTPHDRRRKTFKKNAMKTNGIRWQSEKMMDIFTRGPVPFMYNY